MKARVGRESRPRASHVHLANLLLGTASFALLFHYSVYPQDLNESRRLPGEFGRGDEIALPHCSDTAGGCEAWAASGECDRRPNFMYQSCPKACGGCSKRYEHSPPHRVDLRPGVSMPAVGFGTAGLGDGTARAVVEALNVGYRKIDGAQAREWYREDLIGQALQLSSVRREDIFLTTKVHPRDFGAQATMRAVQRSLGDLGTEYLDLVLLHYSKCWGDICGGTVAKGTWQQSWALLEKLVDNSTVRCLGVSNFNLDEMAELVAVARHKPCLVQLNSEPLRPALAAQAFCKRHGIQFEGYSTLGGQYSWQGRGNPVLEHPEVVAIAQEHGRTAAQVVLRWALQLGQTVIPRTSKFERMRSNFDLFAFDLSDGDMDRLTSLADSDTS